MCWADDNRGIPVKQHQQRKRRTNINTRMAKTIEMSKRMLFSTDPTHFRTWQMDNLINRNFRHYIFLTSFRRVQKKKNCCLHAITFQYLLPLPWTFRLLIWCGEYRLHCTHYAFYVLYRIFGCCTITFSLICNQQLLVSIAFFTEYFIECVKFLSNQISIENSYRFFSLCLSLISLIWST